MMMLLVDGGKIIDYTAEEGYYTVKNDSAPSMFNGSLKDAIARDLQSFQIWWRNSQKQQVFILICKKLKALNLEHLRH